MVSFMGLVLFLGLIGGGGLPLGLPPGPEDPVVANAAPEDCLLYLSWAGTAEPDPKSENRAERLLAEPEVRQMVAEVERRIREGLRKGASGLSLEQAKTVDEIADLVKRALTSPAAVYLAKMEIGERLTLQAGAIVGLGADAAKVRATLARYAKEFPLLFQEVTVGGETFWRMPSEPESPPVTMGVHGKHLVVGIGAGEAQAIVQRMAGKPPAWLAQVRRELPVERPSSVMYVNMNLIMSLVPDMLSPISREADIGIRFLGLNNFTSLATVSGLEKTGFVTKALLGTIKPEGDIFSFLNAKPLEASDLAPIPKDATLAKAARFDAGRVWEMVLATMAKSDPLVAEAAATGIDGIERSLGFKIREDLLQPLGDVWCVYSSPGEGGLVVTGLTAVVRLKDPQRAAKTYGRLMTLLKDDLDRQRQRSPRDAPRLDEYTLAGKKIYTFNFPEGESPVAPSWCLTEKELIVALFPQQVKAYLVRGRDFQSLAAVPEVAELLRSQSGPVVVGYVDTAELFRVVYPMVQMGVKLLTRQLQREGIDVDMSILPSAASIHKHLRPGLISVRRSKAGIEITTRQSLPGAGAAIVLPMAAFAVIGVMYHY